jgi:hypothetical protein
MKSKCALSIVASLAISLSAHAFQLISPEEANLPDSEPMKFRAITRGPGVKQLAPDFAAGPIRAPFNLKLAFEPHGGAKIDLGSVKVSYLKATPVDLLDRVKPGLSASGIDLPGAEVPPGKHQIRVSLRDTEGRQGSVVIDLHVVK